jgi:hypothetical protein
MFWEGEKRRAPGPIDSIRKIPSRPIKYRDLPSTAFNQTSTFKLPGSIRDAWPLDTQHFDEQILGDRERVTVSAVTHHQQPTR